MQVKEDDQNNQKPCEPPLLLTAFNNSQAKDQETALQFNFRRTDPDVKIGNEEYVQAKHRTNRNTLEPQFEGPYQVVGKLGFTTYKLDRRRKVEPYHVSQLKLTKPTRLLLRMGVAVLTLFLLLAFVVAEPNSNNNFSITAPVLWHTTNFAVATGQNTTEHVAILYSPCEPLRAYTKRLAKSPNRSHSHQAILDNLACEHDYQARVIEVIKENCQVVDHLSVFNNAHHQSKRQTAHGHTENA